MFDVYKLSHNAGDLKEKIAFCNFLHAGPFELLYNKGRGYDTILPLQLTYEKMTETHVLLPSLSIPI